MSEAVTVEFELTPEDWIAAQGVHYEALQARRGEVQKILNTGYAAVAAASALFFVTGLWWAAAATGAAGAYFVRQLPGRIRKATREQLQKAADEGVVRGLFGTHRVELRPEGLLNITDGYEYLTRWHAVQGVEHGEGIFMIYTGTNAFLPIPESAFRGPEELREFSDAFHTLRGLEWDRALASTAETRHRALPQ